MAAPVLQIVVASTRPGRKGLLVGEWLAARAREHGGFEVELVDLAEVGLPLLDEPNHPRLRQYTQDHTWAWSAIVKRADAFAFVFPEYNHGLNAALKNALDFVFLEWSYAAAGSVSYGGVSGGLRAAQMLKQILPALKLVAVQDAVMIPFFTQHVLDGVFRGDKEIDASATAMLDELVKVAGELRPLREQARAALA